jgi:hypothetical protein
MIMALFCDGAEGRVKRSRLLPGKFPVQAGADRSLDP